MQLVERHIIKKTHPFWSQLDRVCLASKNLYNKANFNVRQGMIFAREYSNYFLLDKVLKSTSEYRSLPAKVSQQTLRNLEQNWCSFFEAIKEYKLAPEKFSARPKLPKYKEKEGRHLVIYTKQAVSKKTLKGGRIKLSGLNFSFPTMVNYKCLNQVRVVPQSCCKYLVEILLELKIDTLVIGKNKNWKQKVNLGTRNNQNFTNIPHEKLIEKIKYKCELKGIKVREIEESYTSRASFLDQDEMPVYGEEREGEKIKFSGRRINRGLYRSKSKKRINADVNGSYNILRKAIPNAFAEGIERCVVHPRLVTPTKQKMKGST